MATATASQEVLAEKRKLRKSLFRLDLVFFTVAAIVGIDTLGQASSFGSQTVFWLAVTAVLFFVPYGLLTAELGTTFPVEGAAYEWVRLAFGRLAGAATAVLYWLSNPIWLGGTLAVTAIKALDTLYNWNIEKYAWAEFLVGLAFIWVAVSMNILSLRQMKWVPNLGAIVRLALLALFAILVVVAGASKGYAGSLSGWQPTLPIFIGVLGVLTFNWVGFELSTNASEEMDNPRRDVPRMVLGSGILSAVAYAIPIIGIILVLSTKDLSNVGGFISGYQTVLTNAIGGTGANIVTFFVALAIVFSLLTSGTVWLMGADRMMAIGALSGSGPKALGRFSARFGTPVPVNVASGIVATVFLLATVWVNAVAGGNIVSLFGVVIALAISTTTFSYILVFPSLVVLRRRYPNATRPYRVPGGMVGAFIVAVLCEFWVVAATIFSLWPGLFTDQALKPSSGLDRGPFELTTLVATAVLLAIGVVFYYMGRGHATDEGWPVEGAVSERKDLAGVRRA